MAARKKRAGKLAAAGNRRKKQRKPITPPAVVVPGRRFSNVTPDAIDLRDRPYQPSVAQAPRAEWFPARLLDVKNQGDTNACTGFALAAVLEHLLCSSESHLVPISGFMLYDMARRYDEFPGASTRDTGSSLRGALKGWYHHGASAERLWRTYKMPPPSNDPEQDWWLDAAKRPLGAYYRVETRSITDMHVALNEVGILYASAVCHAGWDKGLDAVKNPAIASIDDIWTIPYQKADPDDGGHAFAIVGYNSRGFLIQNSWDTNWGTGGFGILTYRDWLENAMDCWVAQLGVVTQEHQEVANASTLRTKDGVKGRVQLASDEILRTRELSPFIINMENNGKLSSSGRFRTQKSDVEALVNFHLVEARKRWGLSPSQPVDVAIYAHGGLTDEDTAAKTAAAWIPALYEARVFPIFLMWETGFWQTLTNIIADSVKDVPRTTGGPLDRFGDEMKRWWNKRLEKLLAAPGTAVWGEMKQNADAITGGKDTGGVLLYEAFRNSGLLANLRLHLIGHSAGAIVHSFLIDRLAALKVSFQNLLLMAPAVRVDTFESHVAPHLASGAVAKFTEFHLTDAAEQADPTCGPYRRSLLYLVSHACEGGETTPILGMEKFFTPWLASHEAMKKRVAVVQAPTLQSGATTHGGFDDDEKTRKRIIEICRPSA